MSDKLGDEIDGRGFDGSQLSEAELRELRHRNHVLDGSYPSGKRLMRSVETMEGLGWILRLTQAAPAFAKVTAIWTIIATIGAAITGHLSPIWALIIGGGP